MRASLLLALFATSAAAQWRTDYAAARDEARKAGKPMLVVLRCEQCVDFAKFDREVRAEGFDDFVKVRLTRITGLDLGVFEFDFDLSWAAFFLSADEVVYGRYGGRDAAGDMNRISLAGMRYAAGRALDQHKVGGKPPERAAPMKAEDFKGYKARKGNNCLHCHQINTFRWDEARAAGTFVKEQLRMYPPPENVGFELEVDQGDVVRKVVEGSPAAKAGLNADDRVVRIDDKMLASYADAQHALHHAKSPVAVSWVRAGRLMDGKLVLADGWRNTDPAWRTSRLDTTPTLQLSGADLSAADKKGLGLPESQAAVRQDKFVHSTLKAAGLKAGDVVIAIDGKPVLGAMEEMLARVRRDHVVGDEVVLDVRRDGQAVEVRLKLK